MKIKLLVISLFMSLGAFTVSAQDNALGLRFGGTSGISYRHDTNANKAVEGILGFWGNGFSVTGLLERHVTAFNEPALRWYYGAGAHVAFFNNNSPGNDYGRGDRAYTDSEIAMGIDGLLELEYQFTDIPFALSFGLKPFLEIDTDGGFHGGPDPAFSLKFRF